MVLLEGMSNVVGKPEFFENDRRQFSLRDADHFPLQIVRETPFGLPA